MPAVALPPPHKHTRHMHVCLPCRKPVWKCTPIPGDERYAADPYMGVSLFRLLPEGSYGMCTLPNFQLASSIYTFRFHLSFHLLVHLVLRQASNLRIYPLLPRREQEDKVEQLLRQGLSDRAKVVRVLRRPLASTLKPEDLATVGLPPLACSPSTGGAPEGASSGAGALAAVPTVWAGAVVDPLLAQRLVDVGPAADDAAAAARFRRFWGERSELRRWARTQPVVKAATAVLADPAAPRPLGMGWAGSLGICLCPRCMPFDHVLSTVS